MALLESFKETWMQKRLYLYVVLAHLLSGCQNNLHSFLLQKDIRKFWETWMESHLSGGLYILACVVALIVAWMIGVEGMYKIGLKRYLLVGIAASSFGCISLACLDFAATNSQELAFILALFLGQLLSFLGTIIIYAANLLYIVILFPKSVSFLVGISELVSSFAEIIGISLGSLLKDAGGFMLPFLLFGILLLILLGLIRIQLPEHYGDNSVRNVQVLSPIPGVDISGKLILNFWNLFKIPPTFLMVSVMTILGITWSFLLSSIDPQFQRPPHNLDDEAILVLHALSSVTYLIACPAWGYYASTLCNSRRWILIVLGLFSGGLILTITGILLLHDLHEYIAETVAYVFCILALTISFSASFVPIFQTCIVYSLHSNYAKNNHTYGTVSLWVSIALAVGSCIGTTGGFLPMLQLTSYSLLLLIFGCLVILWGIIIVVVFGCRLRWSNPSPQIRPSQRPNTMILRNKIRMFNHFFAGVDISVDETIDTVELK